MSPALADRFLTTSATWEALGVVHVWGGFGRGGGSGGAVWPRLEPRGILVPRSGAKPAPSAVEMQHLNHSTARKVPL